MPKYRKLPVVIEAEQLRWDNWDRICEFVGVPDNGWGIDEDFPRIAMMIPTLEGTMKASQDDYIIKGVNNEFYPCKPEIFEKTYEAVDEDRVESGPIIATPVGSTNSDVGGISSLFGTLLAGDFWASPAVKELFEEMDQLFGTAQAEPTDNGRSGY